MWCTANAGFFNIVVTVHVCACVCVCVRVCGMGGGVGFNFVGCGMWQMAHVCTRACITAFHAAELCSSNALEAARLYACIQLNIAGCCAMQLQ